MIDFACGNCGSRFRIGDEKAGKVGQCPKCRATIQIPRVSGVASVAPAAAPRRAGPSDGLAPPAGVAPAHAHAPAPAPAVQASASVDPLAALAGAAGGGYDAPVEAFNTPPARPQRPGSRPHGESSHGSYDRPQRVYGMHSATHPLAPEREAMTRKVRLIVLGGLLLLSFLLPMVMYVGEWQVLFFWDMVSAPRMPGSMRFMVVYPAIAGLAVVLVSALAPVLVRGIVTIVCGVVPIIVLLADESISRTIGQSLGGANVFGLLFSAIAVTLLIVGLRLRRYRPVWLPAYVIAAVGAGMTLLYLVLPVTPEREGRLPIIGPFNLFDRDKVMATFAVLSLLMQIGCAAVCLSTHPRLKARAALTLTLLALILLIASVAMPVIGGMISPLVNNPNVKPEMFFAFILLLVKFLLWIGGLALLLPLGVTDVVLGDPEAAERV